MQKKFWCLLIICNSLFSQKNFTDSLKEIGTKNLDTNKINTICRLSLRIAESSPLESIFYINYAITKSKELKFHKGLAKAYNIKGICFDVTSKYDSAIICYQTSIKICNANNLLLIKASVLNNLGLIYWNVGNYKLANATYFEALKQFELLKDKTGIAKTNNNIGLINADIQNYAAALMNYKKALLLYNELNDQHGKASVFTNMGIAYSETARNELALSYVDSSIFVKREIKDSYGLGISLVTKSDYLIEILDYANAEKCLKEAEEIFITIGEKNRLTSVYNFLAGLNRNKKNYILVEFYARKMLSLAEEIKSMRKRQTATIVLARNYFDMGQYKNAYLFEEKAKILRDSLINIESIESINELKEKYEAEKKDLTIANSELIISREQKNNYLKNIVIVSLVIFVLFIVILLVIYFTNKRTKQQVQNEQKASLMIIDTEQKERVRIARELHDGIGQKLTVLKMISSTNTVNEDNSLYLKLLDDTITEVRTLSHNMIPEILNLGLLPAIKDLAEKINLSNNMQCNLKIDAENLDVLFSKETELSIYRIVQEILNNMLKHSKASKIEISLNKLNSKTYLTLVDNGIGFDVKTIKHSKGIGWQNIFTRAKLIDAIIDIKSSAKGTNIKLTLAN